MGDKAAAKQEMVAAESRMPAIKGATTLEEVLSR